MPSSQTDKLLSNIQEYTSLLQFLDQEHPAILSEWKNKNAGVNQTPASSTNSTTLANNRGDDVT